MRRLIIAIIALLFAFPLARSTEAHVIWIETNPKGEPGKEHKVELYFGEPHQFRREEAGGLLDRHDEVEAWAIGLKGEKIKIDFKKGVNLFSGIITPQKAGKHHILAKSLGGAPRDNIRSLFFARAQFFSFQKGRVREREEEIKEQMELDILPVTRSLDPLLGSIAPKAGSEFVVRVIFKGNALTGQEVQAHGPNGWIKELQSTDSWGVTSFVPLWPGLYVVQVMHDEKSVGEFQGKRYELLNRRATLSFIVEDFLGR